MASQCRHDDSQKRRNGKGELVCRGCDAERAQRYRARRSGGYGVFRILATRAWRHG